jgi:hypothetical protein
MRRLQKGHDAKRRRRRTSTEDWVFTIGSPCYKDMIALNGALNRESDAPRAAATITTDSGGFRPKHHSCCTLSTNDRSLHPTATTKPQPGEARHNPRRHHGTTSKRPSAPDPTTKVASDQQHPRGGVKEQRHLVDVHCPHAATARRPQPATATANRPATAKPWPATATASRPQPQPRAATTSRNRPPPTTAA